MKHLLFAVLILASLVPLARAGEKPNTVLIHPGEVLYARFEEKGKKLKLLGFSKENDEKAQLILSLQPEAKGPRFTLTLQNRFPKDVIYKVEMRLLSKDVRVPATVYPVVAGKMSFDEIFSKTEEVAVYGFELIL